jgi:hypothetical protein
MIPSAPGAGSVDTYWDRLRPIFPEAVAARLDALPRARRLSGRLLPYKDWMRALFPG